MIEARAPGKLLVSGEYAVLEGAPAIACAVARQVTVRLAGADLAEEPEAARWRKAAGKLFRGRGIEGLPSRPRLAIDSRPLHSPAGTKYGLGSSAAVAAGVTGALLASCGPLPGRQEQAELAVALHRRLQGSGGSGVDVAASVHGGVIAMRGNRAEPLRWPEGLLCAVIWSGRAANTIPAIGRFRNALKDPAGPAAAALTGLSAAASEVTTAWCRSAGAALAALERYTLAWQELDRSAGLDAFSLPHRKLLGLARAAGCVYKPSGAGGGDCGLAFAQDQGRLGQLRELAGKAGFALLDMDLAAPGLQVRRYPENS